MSANQLISPIQFVQKDSVVIAHDSIQSYCVPIEKLVKPTTVWRVPPQSDLNFEYSHSFYPYANIGSKGHNFRHIFFVQPWPIAT